MRIFLTDSPYFGNYERMTVAWRLAVGEVDGEPAIVLLERGPDAAFARSSRRRRRAHHAHRGLLAYAVDSPSREFRGDRSAESVADAGIARRILNRLPPVIQV